MTRNIKIMSILNITPDSFSDGGLFLEKNSALEHVKKSMQDGADIIDIGAESTAPQNSAISADEEWHRIKNIIPDIFSYIQEYNSQNTNNLKNDIIISLDSYKSVIWKKFLDSAQKNNFNLNNIILNDVSGLAIDYSEKIEIIKKYTKLYTNLKICIMFDKNKTHRELTSKNIISEIINFFDTIILTFQIEKINIKHIILDPGMGGFLSKNSDVSFSLIKQLKLLRDFANTNNISDILIGTSRKSFLSEITADNKKVLASVFTSVECIQNGANIIRMHDTKSMKKGLNYFI
ncbi:TPA: dihydropteroate synthase [Candidatus Gracilibacteria bacterium]|nr:dihydropteroate synthase [Candidatus Gracilibacteria bacterium]